MKLEIKNFTQVEWNKIIADFEDLSLIQTWEFAEAKKKDSGWEVVRFVFCEGGEIIGACQGMVKKVPFLDRGLIWLNRGPLWKRSGNIADSQRLIYMLKELKHYWVDEKKMYLRIVPHLLDEDENKNILEKAGFKICVSRLKWTSARIDLRKSEEELFQRLRKRWKQYFRRLDEQKVVCNTVTSLQDLDTMLLDYQSLVKEKKMELGPSQTPMFLKELQKLLPESNKMLIFVAQKDQIVLGRLLIVRYGDNCMAYIIGQNLEGKELHVNHFLYWEAIKKMKELGCKWFDVGGMDERMSAPGIIHFKEGLGGISYRLVGEFEAYQKNIVNSLIGWQIKSKSRI